MPENADFYRDRTVISDLSLPPDADPGKTLPAPPPPETSDNPRNTLRERKLVHAQPQRRRRGTAGETVSAESPASPQAQAESDFVIESLLGEGGMGSVFLARQSSINRPIALKVIKNQKELDEYALHGFIAEASVTGELDHPNIIPVYDLGADEQGNAFYAMKRVVGRSWADLMPTLSLAENLAVLLRAADAVAFAHARGVLHRDLKPENIMLGDFGEALVMDWGLAVRCEPVGGREGLPVSRSATLLNGRNALAGTPSYMAPEMALGDAARIDARSDIYLLGAILYEILAGNPPHGGGTVLACLELAARNEILPARVPPEQDELMQVALRALSAEPPARFASVKEFQAAIREYQAHVECIELVARAREALATAMRGSDYDAFARVVFRFEEAVRMWPEYDRARRGLTVSKLAYAGCAFSRGNLELAQTQLDPACPEHASLLEKVRQAVERERQLKRKQHRQQLVRLARRTVFMLFVLYILASQFCDWHARRVTGSEVSAPQTPITESSAKRRVK